MPREVWGTLVQERSTAVEKQKVIERYERTTHVLGGCSVRTDADPSDTAVDTALRWFRSKAADADYGIERPSANAAHAAMDAEAASGIRVTSVCALVDECSHQGQRGDEAGTRSQCRNPQRFCLTARTAAV